MPPRKKPKAPTTLPLFDVYRSPESVQRFEPDRVRGATLRSRISRGISETLREAQTSTGDVLNRAAVAVAMGEWLDTPVSKAVLDKYAAVSSEEHEITVSRMLALIIATNDHRVLTMVADEVGLALVPKRYQYAIDELEARDTAEGLQQQLQDIQSKINDLQRGRKS
ncbi:MAG: DNA transposition protein [Pusillimonas sp.]|nr:DNA transposition protein [Pusillimonas sp.]|tara:strand:- start:39328 stop:39828 length:501 start_codon:yes stop_codon:yes gene_type:complete